MFTVNGGVLLLSVDLFDLFDMFYDFYSSSNPYCCLISPPLPSHRSTSPHSPLPISSPLFHHRTYPPSPLTHFLFPLLLPYNSPPPPLPPPNPSYQYPSPHPSLPLTLSPPKAPPTQSALPPPHDPLAPRHPDPATNYWQNYR